jgi:hypothetical protein
MIGPLYSAMTAALLTVRIEIADFDALTAAILPFNLKVGFVHHSDHSSQRGVSPAGGGFKRYY